MIFFIAFPFLAVGCACFLLGAAVPPLRRFALSSSLWCIACIPCLFAFLAAVVLWSLGVDALRRLLRMDFGASLSFHQTSLLGWFLAITAIIVTVAGATAITLIHGIIIRRLTLALFRLYVAVVSFGVGILACSFVLFTFAMHLLSLAAFLPAVLASLLAATALASVCFRNASGFRGSYPQRLPVVSPEEFGQI
ncbi:MAG TPA: hypothetical protein VGG81_03575 [Edaphobacter sp.]|jgi:hypothetical protein